MSTADTTRTDREFRVIAERRNSRGRLVTTSRDIAFDNLESASDAWHQTVLVERHAHIATAPRGHYSIVKIVDNDYAIPGGSRLVEYTKLVTS